MTTSLTKRFALVDNRRFTMLFIILTIDSQLTSSYQARKTDMKSYQGGGGGWSAYLAENVKSESVTDSSSHLAD